MHLDRGDVDNQECTSFEEIEVFYAFSQKRNLNHQDLRGTKKLHPIALGTRSCFRLRFSLSRWGNILTFLIVDSSKLLSFVPGSEDSQAHSEAKTYDHEVPTELAKDEIICLPLIYSIWGFPWKTAGKVQEWLFEIAGKLLMQTWIVCGTRVPWYPQIQSPFDQWDLHVNGGGWKMLKSWCHSWYILTSSMGLSSRSSENKTLSSFS